MGARFFARVQATNTSSATVPMWSLVNGGRRVRLYHLIIGCDAAVSDQASDFAVRAVTARGTSSGTYTPNALDGADAAMLATFDTAWAGNPTITANSELLELPVNQRATVQWFVGPGYEIVISKTSGAGVALMAVNTTSAALYRFSSYFEE